MPELTDARRTLATYAMAGADGLFIAKEIGGERWTCSRCSRLHGRALYDTALQMIAEEEKP